MNRGMLGMRGTWEARRRRMFWVRSFCLSSCLAAGISVLLADGAAVFKSARPGYSWSFPADHGPHPGYRIEWWYYTGHLDARDGRRFGYQFTIFKVETAPWSERDPYPPVLFIAHAALADESQRRLVYHETFQRAFPGMAGVLRTGSGTGFFVESNRVKIDGRRHRLDFGSGDFRLRLDLNAAFDPVRHGRDGFSRKGPERDNASQYYSVVGLSGTAELRLAGERVAIERASGWMDHEFSSNFLGDGQRGWDWFWFELDSGERLMVFRVRSAEGGAAGDFYAGTLIAADGRKRGLDARSLRIVPGRTWTAPKSGAQYPVEFRLELEQEFLQVSAWFPENELRTKVAGITYWEGPIDVRGRFRGREVQGRGFLEMTGYAESVGKRF